MEKMLLLMMIMEILMNEKIMEMMMMEMDIRTIMELLMVLVLVLAIMIRGNGRQGIGGEQVVILHPEQDSCDDSGSSRGKSGHSAAGPDAALLHGPAGDCWSHRAETVQLCCRPVALLSVS
eukprot:753012-Hanusia_phi.AAC.10